ncbi:MAG: AraC family transcriptional regulator [Paenibacillus sp.]|nr:AraC family transcriptional regulator [Paenibacillus sp.]
MDYEAYPLEETVSIPSLYSFHYHELSKHFVFQGESHDFWELLYVDRGRVEAFAYNGNYLLEQGQLLVYKPNMFHALKCIDDIAPNLVNISFESVSPRLTYFENRTITLNDAERQLLVDIVQEGLQTFDPPIDRVNRKRGLHRKPDAPIGGEQLIKNGLERLLIVLMRRDASSVKQPEKLTGATRERLEHELVERVAAYVREHANVPFSLERLCAYANIGKSQLKHIFSSRAGIRLHELYLYEKIRQAKAMIREEPGNFTEIAERLGYSSIHYFSRHFKKATGMTPSEYAKSVKARTRET